MLIHHLSGSAPEWRLALSPSPRASHQANTDPSGCPPHPANCSGLANSGVPANAPGDEIPASEADSSTAFARPRSIIFAVRRLPPQAHHYIGGFDVPVNKVLFVHRSQTGGDLHRDFQRELYLQPAGAFDEVLAVSALPQTPSRKSSSDRFCPGERPRQHLGDGRSLPRGLRAKSEGAPILHRDTFH